MTLAQATSRAVPMKASSTQTVRPWGSRNPSDNQLRGRLVVGGGYYNCHTWQCTGWLYFYSPFISLELPGAWHMSRSVKFWWRNQALPFTHPPLIQRNRLHSEYLVRNPVQATLRSYSRQNANKNCEYFWLGMSARPEASRNLF